MDIRAEYATDDKLEVEGVERDIGGGAKLLIARSGNSAFSDLMAKLYEQNKTALDQKTPESEALNKKLMVSVLARTILVGWSGITEGKGADKVDVPYSVEKAEEYLGYKDFQALVTRLAAEREPYLLEKAQAEAGNSVSA